jgi:hypothetical protein
MAGLPRRVPLYYFSTAARMYTPASTSSGTASMAIPASTPRASRPGRGGTAGMRLIRCGESGDHTRFWAMYGNGASMNGNLRTSCRTPPLVTAAQRNVRYLGWRHERPAGSVPVRGRSGEPRQFPWRWMRPSPRQEMQGRRVSTIPFHPGLIRRETAFGVRLSAKKVRFSNADERRVRRDKNGCTVLCQSQWPIGGRRAVPPAGTGVQIRLP